jgi:hypothetical protein
MSPFGGGQLSLPCQSSEAHRKLKIKYLQYEIPAARTFGKVSSDALAAEGKSLPVVYRLSRPEGESKSWLNQ